MTTRSPYYLALASHALLLLASSAPRGVSAQGSMLPTNGNWSAPKCDMGKLMPAINNLNAVCCKSDGCARGPPKDCSVECGSTLFALTGPCGSLLHVLFDAEDGKRDGHSDTIESMSAKCLALQPADVLGELRNLTLRGRCPASVMEGVGRTPIQPGKCEDKRANCAAGIKGGFVSCKKDFCPTCGLARQCDQTCGICKKGGGAKSHVCKDVRSNCQAGITAGFVHCAKDFCPHCGLAGQCDKTCGICNTRHHRLRRLQGLNLGSCTMKTFTAGAKLVHDACCDIVRGKSSCKGGLPSECDARCGVVYIDFFRRCSNLLHVYAPAQMDVYTRLKTTCEEELPVLPLLELAGRCSGGGGGGFAHLTSTSSSACPVTDGGKCVHSRGYPSSNYKGHDHCTIQVHGAGNLRALPGFNVESGSDYLTIDGHKYGGHDSKSGFSVKVTSSSKITWATDGSVQYHGWKVCIGPAPPPPPPPPPGSVAHVTITIRGAGHARTNGVYSQAGQYNRHPYWQKVGSDGRIYFKSGSSYGWVTNEENQFRNWEYIGGTGAMPPAGTWSKTSSSEPSRAKNPRPTITYGSSSGTWVKHTNKYCKGNQFKSFKSLAAAEQACSADAKCNSVYDGSCDGGYELCPDHVSDFQDSSTGSCMYTPSSTQPSGWFKFAQKYCEGNDYKSFSTLAAATRACSVDSKCKAVYDSNCDGAGYSLCPDDVSKFAKSGSGSCMYAALPNNGKKCCSQWCAGCGHCRPGKCGTACGNNGNKPSCENAYRTCNPVC